MSFILAVDIWVNSPAIREITTSEMSRNLSAVLGQAEQDETIAVPVGLV